MDIVINGRFLTQQLTGVQRYAIELVKSLDKKFIDLTVEAQLVVPEGYDVKELPFALETIKLVHYGKRRGHSWEQVDLAFFSRKKFLVNLCNTGPIFKMNQSITLHDAAVFSAPEGFNWKFKLWYKLLFHSFSLFASRIVTVSNFSKSELIHHCILNEKKVEVIYSGINHINEVSEDKKFNVHSYGDYVLVVSSMNPNKNYSRIVEAAALLNPNLNILITGGANPKVFNPSILSNQNNIHYLGYVTDEQLKTLYSHAYCFLFPSLYEGFGLPPLEAMACGCPVIVSRIPCLQEICGDAAIYCDPMSVDDIAEVINQLYEDKNRKAAFVQRSLNHSSKFKWDYTSEKFMNTIIMNKINDKVMYEGRYSDCE